MCLHISKNKSKPLTKSSRTKQSRKSSYTIPEGLPNERHGECVKAKKMFFYPKQDPFLDENHQQKREVNLNQWIKMAKGYNGLN
jgi:hypothetical protein